MNNNDKSLYSEIILEHIEAVKTYTPGSKQELLVDVKTYDAILMRLMAIGEELISVRSMLEENDFSHEWHKVIGLRNRIAHGYWEVDKDAIWELLTDGSLESLKQALEP
jgi:uncharacterized protein with HEPN domain